MLFGDPFIGKSIQVKREAKGLSQIKLAILIGIEKSTMNRYEKGVYAVPEAVLERIAEVLGCALIDLLDTAYAIYRFNYFRDRAQREGVDLEELIARHDPRASIEEVTATHALYTEKRLEYELKLIEWVHGEKSAGASMLRLIVETEEERETRKAESPRKRPAKKRGNS